MTAEIRGVIAREIAGDSIDYSKAQHDRAFRLANGVIAALAAKGLVIVSGADLKQVERFLNGIRGAVESGQIADKDVRGSAVQGRDILREMLAANGCDDG